MTLLAGCGGGDFDLPPDLTRTRGSSAGTLAPTPVNTTIRVPTEQPFILSYPTSQQQGGGKADATADAAGKAEVQATCVNEGTAVAEFRLGHMFDAPRGAAAVAAIQLELSGETGHHSSGGAEADSAMSDLWIFVKDSTGAVLHKETLLTDSGYASHGRFHLQERFDLPLTGGDGYYVVIGGRSRANGQPKGQCDARLFLEKSEVEIAIRPAPAGSAASQSSP